MTMNDWMENVFEVQSLRPRRGGEGQGEGAIHHGLPQTRWLASGGGLPQLGRAIQSL